MSLRRIARQSEADVVLTLYGGSYAVMAWLSGIRPYVVYVVGSDVLSAKGFEERAAKVTLPRAVMVLANGKHLAERTLAMAPAAAVTPLYLGADLDTYRPATKLPEVPTFLCTRGFLPVYDNRTIVRALSLLGDELLAMKFAFASSGPLLPEAIALADTELQGLVRQRVAFLGGVSDVELKTALHSSSFYLSASLSDGTSSSLLEAMACGLLPIVSDISANREWISHAKNGLLFPAGDEHALADCIRRAATNEPWMGAARVANRRLVEERADATVNMTVLAGFLTSSRDRRT